MLHILLRVLHLLGEDSSYIYPVVDGEGTSIKVEANSIHIPNHHGENDCKHLYHVRDYLRRILL